MSPDVQTIIIAMFGSTGLWSVISLLIQVYREKKDNPLLGIYYYLLMEKCDFYLQQGWISYEDFIDLDKYLYQPYKKKGGNGSAEKAMRKVEGLPNEKPKGGRA